MWDNNPIITNMIFPMSMSDFKRRNFNKWTYLDWGVFGMPCLVNPQYVLADAGLVIPTISHSNYIKVERNGLHDGTRDLSILVFFMHIVTTGSFY